MFTPRRIVHSLVTLLMLATLGMTQNKPTTQTSSNSQPRKTENFAAEMKRLRDTWVKEFNARNAKGVADLYAPDAVLMRWDGTVHGYDSILAEFERSATGNAHNYVVHPLHVEHSGDLAYETGAYNVTLREGDAVFINTGWGDLFLEKYNNAEALKSYQAAFEADSSWVPALLGAAHALDNDDPPQAAAMIKRVLQINPKSADAQPKVRPQEDLEDIVLDESKSG